MTNIDEQLLNTNQQNEAAGVLKEKKKGGGEEGGDEAGGESRSLRQRVQAARQAMDLKQKAKEKIKEKVTAPAKLGTDWLLRVAWGLMMGFITFIPGVLLADLHVFGRMTLGKKFFCDLGDEWPGSKMVNAVGPAKLFKSLGEKMGLVAANAIAFFVIIAIVSLLAWLNDNLIFKVIDKVSGIGQWIFSSNN
ncbi:MAG: hypothetical protein WCL13_00010 [bacterium]